MVSRGGKEEGGSEQVRRFVTYTAPRTTGNVVVVVVLVGFSQLPELSPDPQVCVLELSVSVEGNGSLFTRVGGSESKKCGCRSGGMALGRRTITMPWRGSC